MASKMNEQQAQALIGKTAILYWKDENGKEQSMEGLIEKVEDGWIQVDYGYAVLYRYVDRWEA